VTVSVVVGGLTVSWNDAVALAFVTSVTWIVKLYGPALAGVPVSAPLLLSDRPGGKTPPVTDQATYGGIPPVAVSVCE
jgi:hypothetical protein